MIGEFNLAYEPHKVRILTYACKTVYFIKRMDDASAKAPLTVKGSMGLGVTSTPSVCSGSPPT